MSIERFCGGCDMKKILAAGVITLAVAPSGVLAQERAGDAALGALSGAVVLGPIGAVAGAVVGYTAGPSIAHSWGLRRSSGAYRGGTICKRVRFEATRTTGHCGGTDSGGL